MAQFVYGKNVVKQMLMDNSKVKQIYMSVDDRDVERLARKQRVQLKRVDKKTLTQMTKTDRHQGVVAEVDPYRLYSVDEILQGVSENGKGLIIMLDELEDPHNLGAILRTADAIGATGVIFKKTNCEMCFCYQSFQNARRPSEKRLVGCWNRYGWTGLSFCKV